MRPSEQQLWGKIYYQLHLAANTFRTDRCLLFRKILTRNRGTPIRRGNIPGDYVSLDNYVEWLNVLLKNRVTSKVDILENIQRGGGVTEGQEVDKSSFVIGRRLDALCVLRGSRMTSAVVCCEANIQGYYERLVKQEILSSWLARLLDGTNMAELVPVGGPSWPSLSNDTRE